MRQSQTQKTYRLSQKLLALGDYRHGVTIIVCMAAWLMISCNTSTNIQGDLSSTSTNEVYQPSKLDPQTANNSITATSETVFGNQFATRTSHIQAESTGISEPTLTLNAPNNQPALVITPSQLNKACDLLYLNSRKLMRWDPMTGYTIPLVDNVSVYSKSPDGTRLVLLRPRAITANGVDLFDLAVFNFKTMQMHNLLADTPRVSNLSISPDNRWVSFISSETENHIYILEIDEPGTIIDLGTCTKSTLESCDHLIWSFDSKDLLWNDSNGVWMYSLDSASTKLVHNNLAKITDPNGNLTEISIAFNNLVWSPEGRYLITEVFPHESDVFWYSVLDTRRERLVRITGSYEFTPPNSAVIWLDDGSLLEINNGSDNETGIPSLRQWEMVDTRDNLLVLIHETELHLDVLPFIAEDDSGNYFNISSLIQVGKDQLNLEVDFSTNLDIPSLFSINSITGMINKQFDLPFQPIELIWVPDGSGALIIGPEADIIYISMHNETALNLQHILGPKARNFNWQLPIPR